MITMTTMKTNIVPAVAAMARPNNQQKQNKGNQQQDRRYPHFEDILAYECARLKRMEGVA